MRAKINLSRPCHARITSMKILLWLAYVATTSMPFLLRHYYILTASWLSHVLTTPFWTCSKFDHVIHVHEDLTTLLSVSKTHLLRPTSSYCVHPIFQGSSKNAAECEGGITHLLHVTAKARTNIRICTVLSHKSLHCSLTQNMDVDKYSDQIIGL